MKCLMIETKDRRQFFTHEKNFNQLIEFSKCFEAQLSLVQVASVKLLSLEQLAPALCDTTRKKQKIDFKTMEVKLNFSKNKKKSNSEKIKKSIKKTFLLRKTVSTKSIKLKFKNLNLSNSSFCNYLKKVKDELRKQGYKFIKTGAGEYRII